MFHHPNMRGNMTKPPAVGSDLVEYLEAQFAPVIPDEGGNSEQLLMETARKQGEKRVLDHLRSLVSRQERGALRTVLS
jgi:hypothetical protein